LGKPSRADAIDCDLVRSMIVLVVGQTFRKTHYQNDVFIVSSNFIDPNILRRTSEDELSEDLSETMMTLND
jgi:hypothetical protein